MFVVVVAVLLVVSFVCFAHLGSAEIWTNVCCCLFQCCAILSEYYRAGTV